MSSPDALPVSKATSVAFVIGGQTDAPQLIRGLHWHAYLLCVPEGSRRACLTRDPLMQDDETSNASAPEGRKRAKGIYMVPNMITLAALFGGFFAIVMAMNGRFEMATVAIFVAMVLDSLDGRVARHDQHPERVR